MLLKVLFQSVPPDMLSAVRMHPKSVAFRNSIFQLKATICQTNLNVEDPHVDIILDDCPLQHRDLNISFIMRQDASGFKCCKVTMWNYINYIKKPKHQSHPIPSIPHSYSTHFTPQTKPFVFVGGTSTRFGLLGVFRKAHGDLTEQLLHLGRVLFLENLEECFNFLDQIVL